MCVRIEVLEFVQCNRTDNWRMGCMNDSEYVFVCDDIDVKQ